jgi:hypothetical protein
MIKRAYSVSAIFLKYLAARVIIFFKPMVNASKLKYAQMKSFVEKDVSTEDVYKDLTPKEELESNKAYIESLDWAISNDNVLNIALSGPYGSGKSSILKTYKENRPYLNYLNISLATFHSYKESTVSDEFVEEKSSEKQSGIEALDESEIEKRILQQLFYKVKSRRIPFARFRKINHIRSTLILKEISLVVIMVILGVFLFTPDLSNKIREISSSKLNGLNYLSLDWWITVSGYFLFSMLLFRFIISTVKVVFRTIKLSKLSVKNATVELNKNDDNSVFNRYLDEILYFFEVNPYQIVFIEDLDRFNDVKIFMKLRELNTLINNSEQINRRVVFIYAVKDEMFMNKDRTKFFDFIIPVIPIVNSTNSGEILWKELEKHNLSEGLTESFVNDICLYIDDMRILNNIFNEYIIYRKKLLNGNTSFLNPLKLFSMIVYKNIYPNDFAKLQYNNGIVYSIFQQKQNIIAEKIAELQHEVKEWENQLILLDKEHLESEKEIRTIYWNEAVGYNANITMVQINGNNYSLSNALDNTFDLSIISNRFTGLRPGYNAIQLSMSKEVSGRLISRLDNVKKKTEEFINKAHDKINEISTLMNDIKSWPLSTAIEEVGVEKFFPTRNYKNGLIVFLLRNGYIDELYPHYINYFYEGSLKHFDMIFIIKVKDQIALDFTHPLSNPTKIMMRLNLADFGRKEVLNFQLVNHILVNRIDYNEQFNIIMNQLSNETEVSVKFIDSFIQCANDQSRFFTELCQRWHNIWNYISGSSIVSENRKHDYLRLILVNAKIDDIKRINSEGKLAQFISTMPLFLEFVPNENISKVKAVIKELEIHFTNLKLTDISNKDLLDFIVENNYYELGISMVELIVCYKSSIVDKDALGRSHLTTIKSINYEPLWNYIQNNIAYYIDNVMFSLTENNSESEEVVIELMNLDEDMLSNEVKEKIILMQSVLISDINTIPNYLWGYVVENNKMKCSWGNILNVYLQDKSINKELVSFLNTENNYNVLSQIKLNSHTAFDKELYKQFSDDLIYCKELTNDSFESLKKSLPYTYSRIPSESLSTARVYGLINYGLINFTKENYADIRENHKQILPELISKHMESFLSNAGDFDVDNTDCLNLISSDKISTDDKVNILNEFGDIIECSSKSYANEVLNVIFKSKEPFQISEQILTSILAQDISQKNKLELLLNQQEFLNYSNMEQYMESIGEPYDKMMASKKRPVIEDTKTNQEILQLLERHGLISSFREEKQGQIRVFAKH